MIKTEQQRELASKMNSTSKIHSPTPERISIPPLVIQCGTQENKKLVLTAVWQNGGFNAKLNIWISNEVWC